MEIRQLKYFSAVADHLSFIRAADAMGVSQSTISEQVRRLEDQLQTQLLFRTKRQVRLTPAGEALRQDLGEIFAQLRSLEARVRDAGGGQRARISVGYSEMAFGSPMPAIVHEFRQQNPLVEVAMREQSSSTIHDAFLTGRVDCAFIPYSEGTARVNFHKAGDIAIHGCVAREDAPRFADGIFSNLGDAPLVLPNRDSALSIYISQALRSRGLGGGEIVRAANAFSIMTLAASGRGIGFVPEALARMQPSEVRIIRFRDVDLKLPFGLVWPVWEMRAPMRRFIEHAIRHIEAAGGSAAPQAIP